MSSPTTLEHFIACVERSAHDEAIATFYAPNASMRENQQPPLVEHERRVLGPLAIRCTGVRGRRPRRHPRRPDRRGRVLLRFGATRPQGDGSHGLGPVAEEVAANPYIGRDSLR
jgi:hypothetical protein